MAGADLRSVLCICKKNLGMGKVLIGLANCMVSFVWLPLTVPLSMIESVAVCRHGFLPRLVRDDPCTFDAGAL
jgi:hypothetical protein